MRETQTVFVHRASGLEQGEWPSYKQLQQQGLSVPEYTKNKGMCFWKRKVFYASHDTLTIKLSVFNPASAEPRGFSNSLIDSLKML